MTSSKPLEHLLDRLEAGKRQFGPGTAAETFALLRALGRRRFHDAQSLIRFHEALLFFRAYPANADILRLTEELLDSFSQGIDRFRRDGGDLTPFEEPDVSGIAGTAFSAIFSYDIARWLVTHHGQEIDIDWDACDPTLLGPLLARLHPMFAEDLLVEANIPFREWFQAAKTGAGTDLRWLMERMDRLKIVPEHFDHARIALRWELGHSLTTRTKLRVPGKQPVFYHDQPLLRRSDISLQTELQARPLTLQKLKRQDADDMLDLFRETSAMRYRELHGFTYGDPAHMIHTDLGRGVEVFVAGVPPEHRLPLRAYHAGMFFKNRVPIGYIECLTFFERIEVGFNLYYTFREGETAWLYARLLRLFRQLLGVSSFAVDPYQLGFHNQEAIDSGAFWFYRKLGFRPANSRVVRLLETEEAKLLANPTYRTPARTLERLSVGWMLYELPGTPQAGWDRFEIRRLAMALRKAPFPAQIERAKRGSDESEYVRLLQRDSQLRRRLIKLGSK